MFVVCHDRDMHRSYVTGVAAKEADCRVVKWVVWYSRDGLGKMEINANNLGRLCGYRLKGEGPREDHQWNESV